MTEGIIILALLLWVFYLYLRPQPHIYEPDVVLVVKVLDDGFGMQVTMVPSRSCEMCHVAFAASLLSAEAVVRLDHGIEGGLETMQRATMDVLNRRAQQQ